MRTEEKKREALRLKEQKKSPSDTPSRGEISTAKVNGQKNRPEEEQIKSLEVAPLEEEAKPSNFSIKAPKEGADKVESSRSQDIPRTSIEVI